MSAPQLKACQNYQSCLERPVHLGGAWAAYQAVLTLPNNDDNCNNSNSRSNSADGKQAVITLVIVIAIIIAVRITQVREIMIIIIVVTDPWELLL